MRVALLDNDPAEAKKIRQWLTAAGSLCCSFEQANTLLCAIGRETFDVVVLDWGHSDSGDVDTLKRVRGALRTRASILLISGGTSGADIVTGLVVGADDYIVKPLRNLEFLTRIEALGCRRPKERAQSSVLELGSLRLDRAARAAFRDGRLIHLNPKDFDLAVHFLLNIGRLIPYEEMREVAWCAGEVPSARTLYTHVSYIRNRLGLTPRNALRLLAVYGMGYRLDESIELSANKPVRPIAVSLQSVMASR